MPTRPFFRVVGVAAYLNAVANTISFVAFIMFFAVGGPFGTINDSASVWFSVSLIPLALALHRWHRSQFPVVSLVSEGVGIAAMVTAAALQTLLVFGVVHFGQTVRAVLTANALIGAWLVVSGLLARRERTLPQRLVWLMLSAGGGLVTVIIGFWVGGPAHPLAAIGGVVAFVGLVLWAIGLGQFVRRVNRARFG